MDKTIEDEYVNMGYDEEDELASKYIEVHYIELPKFKKKELSKFTKLDQWMCIFTQNKEGIIIKITVQGWQKLIENRNM